MSDNLPKIFCWNNGGVPGWYTMEALSEDGVFLAGHICSHEGFGPHDMGVTSDWKHKSYQKYYPGGYEVLWVQPDDPQLLQAYEKHKAISPDEYAKKVSVLGEDTETPSITVELSDGTVITENPLKDLRKMLPPKDQA